MYGLYYVYLQYTVVKVLLSFMMQKERSNGKEDINLSHKVEWGIYLSCHFAGIENLRHLA